MTNENAIDLYNRVHVGTIVVVLQPKQMASIPLAPSSRSF
jgi:hypothetical protein